MDENLFEETHEPVIENADEMIEAMFARLENATVVEDENVIILASNGGTNRRVQTEVPISIAYAMATASIAMKGEYQFFVDGEAVLADHIVAPGTVVHIHTEQNGG